MRTGCWREDCMQEPPLQDYREILALIARQSSNHNMHGQLSQLQRLALLHLPFSVIHAQFPVVGFWKNQRTGSQLTTADMTCCLSQVFFLVEAMVSPFGGVVAWLDPGVC